MPGISRSSASLQFSGDDLDPDELTARLGAKPDLCARKGELIHSAARRMKKVANTGRWSFGVEPRSPGDLDGQIKELFGALSIDLTVWRDLSAKFNPRLFVGLFMNFYNEGVELSSSCLAILSQRNVRLDLDIYGSENDPDGVLSGVASILAREDRGAAEARSGIRWRKSRSEV